MSARFNASLYFLRSKGAVARTWWKSQSKYRQHFFTAVILGIIIEAAIYLAHDWAAVKRVQNSVLDTSIRLFSLREKADNLQAKMPVLLVLDDLSTQSAEWGHDQSVTLKQALQLVGQAFERGSHHVMLDITFDTLPEQLSPENRTALQEFALRFGTADAAGGPRHLYVARTARVDPCFPRDESAETLRQSAWDELKALDLQARPGLVIHSVLPHYRSDTDGVVRGWDLFGVLKDANKGVNEVNPLWRFLPSPQLAYETTTRTPINQLGGLPWLETIETRQQLGVSRASYAAEQIKRVPLLAGDSFRQTLCAHHPHTLGCPALASGTAETPIPSNPQLQLESVNALLKPLPVDQACRARAAERLDFKRLEPTPVERSDLLFNRIVYELPSWEHSENLAQRGYYVRTPLSLQEDTVDWSGRLVAVGAANANSGDWHSTPIGHIPGVLINLNAMHSLERIGPVSDPPAWLSLLLNGLIIVVVAAVFSVLSPLAAATLSAALLIGSLAIFHQFLLSRGIWIEFGAPLIGINLHRIIDGYLAQRRLKAQLLDHKPMALPSQTPLQSPGLRRSRSTRRGK